MRRTIAIAGLVAAWTVPAAAQELSSVPRDRPPAKPRTGTGTIRGRVIDGLTGDAIARARVRLTMAGVSQAVMMSGGEGEFSFDKLPDGAFSISADKATYLQGRFPDQGRTFRSSMRPKRLAAGEALDNVILKMYRGSAIAGRVLDPHGDPVEYASVSVLRVVPGGKPEMRQGTQTNDLGEFRVPRLQAGTYVIAVSPRRISADELPPGSDQEAQPVPTFYPGAVSIDQAQPITLERGQSVAGLDVVLAEGMLVTILGNVVRRDGQPAIGAFVNARSTGRLGMMSGGGAGVRPDGTFRMTLPPGEHVLQANAARNDNNRPAAPDSQQSGIVRLTVGGSPVENVTIVVGPPATASGRVAFEGTTTPPAPPTGDLGLPLGSEDGDCQSGPARVAADWTFKVDRLLGTCQPPSRLTFGRWTLKSATRGSQDLLDKPMTFEPGQQLDNIQLVFTDRQSEVRFRVTDEQGQATTDYVALVFPTDKSRWDNRTGSGVEPFLLPPIDLVREIERTGAQTVELARARRQVMIVAPGEYYIIAVDDIGMEEIRMPAVLERLAASAIRVSVAEGASVEAVLRRIELTQVMR